MDDYLKLVALGISMGAGMMIILRFAPQWFRRKPPTDMLAWMIEIEQASNAAIRDNMCAVQSNAYLFNLVGQVPSDFDPAIFLTANLAANLQRAVLLQAEAEGLVPEGILARVYPETRVTDAPYRTSSPPGEPSLHLVDNDEDDEAAVRWEGNQLVPKSRRRL